MHQWPRWLAWLCERVQKGFCSTPFSLWLSVLTSIRKVIIQNCCDKNIYMTVTISPKKVKRVIFDFFKLWRPSPEWCGVLLWSSNSEHQHHRALYLGPNMAHFTLTVQAGGWKPIRSIFMHISP